MGQLLAETVLRRLGSMVKKLQLGETTKCKCEITGEK